MNYTLNVSIPKALAELAKEQVKKGYYSSVSEVIRESLRAQLISDNVPTFPMSKKAKGILLKAMKDHKEGKTIKVKSFSELI